VILPLFFSLGLASVAQASIDLIAPISASVQAHVADRLGMVAEDVEVEWVGFSGEHSCAAGTTVKVESVPGEQFRGQTQLKIRLNDSGRPCGRFTVPARITLWRDVPVANTAASPGEVIDLGRARVSTKEIHGLLVDPDTGRWLASRTIRAGQPVTRRYAKREPAMANGQSVSIVAIFGGLSIKAEGRMLEDAQIGDWVRVANLATDTVVQGQLTALGTVRTGGRR
jgi:flagella basal body P-ring formation protein FlgA